MPRGSLTQWNQELDRASLQNYTGEQIQQKDPKRYQAIVKAAQEGATSMMLRRIFGVNDRTAKAIVEREAPSSLSNQHLSNRFRHLAGLGLERLIEAVENNEVKAKDLSITSAIAVDKMLTTDEKNGSNNGQNVFVFTSDSLMKLVKTAKPDVIDAEVVETKVLDTKPSNTAPFQGNEKRGGGGQQDRDS